MKYYAEHIETITGLIDVGETIKTIEKIAASSVHAARIEARNLALYRSTLESSLARLVSYVDTNKHSLLHPHTKKGALLIVLTADRGEVGGLWHQVVEKALAQADSYTHLVCIGTKGAQYLAEQGQAVFETLQGFEDVLDTEKVYHTNERFMHDFLHGAYARVDLLCPWYTTLEGQTTSLTTLYPFTVLPPTESAAEEALGFPLFEPSAQAVYRTLVSKYARVLFLSRVAEAKLAELVARTVAMEHAVAQTEERKRASIQAFRRVRRESVTQEQSISMNALQTI